MLRVNWFSFLAVLLVFGAHATENSDANLKSVQNLQNLQNPPFRLPRSIIPVSYRLQLISVLDEIPQYERFTAPGQVWIKVNCTEATTSITLHQIDLMINETNIQVRNSIGSPLTIRSFERVAEYDFFIINMVNDLAAGESYEIYIPYVAVISQTRLDGIYLDSYRDPANNETRYVSTTLFAANTARRAFPSFDEPDLKAQFEIVLGRAGDYHALSNMHLVDSKPMSDMPGWMWDTFAISPRMSTYLVCMIVSDLTYEEAPSDDPDAAIHRIYAPYYFIDRGGGKYSANLSQTVNAAFESYYDISFPLMKLDNVALPQFFYNAMENWGLMTYADRVLLYFEGETSAAQKYQLSLTLSHEVSHNFFGNLVTSKWWTWIWLNEGWATFASHQGLEMTYPELRPWDQFIPNIYQVAMAFDASPGTHPIANEPLTSAAIGGIYDDIAYEKGASVIRMMESFLNEVVLQTGVRRYLQKWQYDVTEQDDLFVELQQAVMEMNPGALPTGVTVKDVMDTWTMQVGYPMLTVTRTTPSQVVIGQEQFVNNGVPSGDEMWWIPLEIQRFSGGNPVTSFTWMSKDVQNVTLSIPEADFFFVNPRSIGYYRVMYNKEFYDTILENYESLTPLMRTKILDDTFALAESGRVDLQIPMKFVEYLDTEYDFIVWKTARRNLGKILTLLDGTEQGNTLRKLVLDKINLVQQVVRKNRQELNFQLLLDELEDWKKKIGYAATKLSEEKVMEMISGLMNPKFNQTGTKTLKEVASEIGQNRDVRQIALQTLKEQLENANSQKESKLLSKLFLEVGKYGSHESDLQFISKINPNLIEDVGLKKLGNIIQSNLQALRKLQIRT